VRIFGIAAVVKKQQFYFICPTTSHLKNNFSLAEEPKENLLPGANRRRYSVRQSPYRRA
jgi:hypothetical protein